LIILTLNNIGVTQDAVYRRMRGAVEASARSIRRIKIRNLYEKLRRLRVGNSEVEDAAKRVAGKNVKKRDEKEVVRILKIRVRECEKNVMISRKEWKRKRKEAMENLTESLKKRYIRLERRVMKNVWMMGKKKDEMKIKQAKMKRDEMKKKSDEVVNRGYKVTDEELEDEMKKDENREVINYVVYDEIVLDEDEESYLKLGPKFREFNDINDEENEIETEIHCIKARMEIRNREEIKDDDGNYSVADRKKIDDDYKLNKKIYEEEGKKLSMAKQRVTDSKYNTRSFPPRMAEKKEEMKIQVQRDELIAGMRGYRKKECIGGRQRESHPSDQEARGKKKLFD
jgi:hypothetical protein